jgi:hypothetical protein
MNRCRILCAVFGIGMFGVAPLASADLRTIKIVVHPGVNATSATTAEIKAVFLETSTRLKDGSRVQPVVLRGSIFEKFSRDFVGKSSIGLETYYRSLVFSGTGIIPKIFTTDDQVIAYVSKTQGAIGYVSGDVPTVGVKVLAVK